jgi:hypothetical protein
MVGPEARRGNHLQWVYGDYAGPMRQVGQMLGLKVEVIA